MRCSPTVHRCVQSSAHVEGIEQVRAVATGTPPGFSFVAIAAVSTGQLLVGERAM
jgi:hypothetical protein